MQSDLNNKQTGAGPSAGQPVVRHAQTESSGLATGKETAQPVGDQAIRKEGAKKVRRPLSHHAGRAMGYVRGTWLGKNWYTIVVLTFLVLLGLFVRSYFGVTPATEDGFLLSGGSDSYYYNHIISYNIETGHHLHIEDMLNYPAGTRNPRPPLYSWSISVMGQVASPLFDGDVTTSMFYVFLFSTAFWGALTVIPTYFMAKEAFGKRAGYIAAFLLAIMPGHIQRSVLTNADHDAMVLFFIVTAFYFFLKSLKNLKGENWVESWRVRGLSDLKRIGGGFRAMVKENKVSALFALLSGFSFLTVALIWQGWAYALVILTAYFGVQVLFNRFRNVESLGLLMVYGIAGGTLVLLAFPYYFQSVQIASWWDSPAYMFAAAFAFGLVLELTRRYPWILVLSALALSAVVAVVVLYAFWPAMYNTLVGALASGAGYFVRNKQYETIAEAQAAPFSNLALSFGVVTFWLSFVGLGYAIYQLPKKLKADYLFIVVWTVASIYMAVTAARFMFNAAPAFAVTSGWVVALIIEKLNLKSAIEQQKRASGMYNPDWDALRSVVVVGLIVIVCGVGAYLYLDNLAPLALAALGLLTLAYLVYAYGVRAKWWFSLVGLMPLAVSLILYTFYYDDFTKTADHLAVPLFGALVLGILFLFVRGARIRTMAGVLFLAFLVVLPNVWQGVDAGIPYETKADYDKQIYESLPSTFTPKTYDAANGSNWYLGAFGYSLPLNSRYYPAAYDWLARQDNNIYPPEDRPAYLSWWDYGFEAVNEGNHPTVADNFLGGHQLAGNFIMAQNESNAITLLIVRLLEGDWTRNAGFGSGTTQSYFSPEVKATLAAYGLDVDGFLDIYNNPGKYVDEIWAHPEIYSPRDDVIQDANARYLAAMGEITMHMNKEQIVSLYHDLSVTTGWQIRYFAIDSRLFPFSGENTGIFYAPAKLSDHRMKDPNMPYDFFEIKAVGTYGGEYSLDDVPDDVKVKEYKLVYNDMFYNTMLYKCFVGYGGKDIGQDNTKGVPGLSGDLEQQEPLQGWNLTHFRRVYRTAYYNPYPSEEVKDHTDAWRAINYDDALSLQTAIQAGRETGVIDPSARSSMYQGVMFLKYYHGAIVTGKVALPDGTPLQGAWVTVQDEYNIPHQTVTTDSEGNYRLLAPFGNVSVVVSTGTLDLVNQVGSELNRTRFFVRDDQAMREEVDQNSDGVWDYLMSNDVTVAGGYLNGTVFLDKDGNGAFSDGVDRVLEGAQVVMRSVKSSLEVVSTSGADGRYNTENLPPGDYDVSAVYLGTVVASATRTSVGGTNSQVKEFPLSKCAIQGVNSYGGGSIANSTVEFRDNSGEVFSVVNASSVGAWNTTLVQGNYTIRAHTADGKFSLPRRVSVTTTANATANMTLYDSTAVSGTVAIYGRAAANATVRFTNLHDLGRDLLARTRANGTFAEQVPEGEYSVYVRVAHQGQEYAYLSTHLLQGDAIVLALDLSLAGRLTGTVRGLQGDLMSDVAILAQGAGTYRSFTNRNGTYEAVVPAGTYNLYMNAQLATGALIYGLERVSIPAGGSRVLDIQPRDGILVSGYVFEDVNGDILMQPTEILKDSRATFTDPSGRQFTLYTNASNGYYQGVASGVEAFSCSVECEGYASLDFEPLIGTALQQRVTNRMTLQSVRVEGTLWSADDTYPLGGAVLRFTRDANYTTEVPVLQDGSYMTTLSPGYYEVTMRRDLTGNGSMDVVHELKERTARLNLQIGSASLEQDFEAVVRNRVGFRFTQYNSTVDAAVRIAGVENYSFETSQYTTTVYLRSGPYGLHAENVSGEYHYVDFASLTVAGPVNVSRELVMASRVTGSVTYIEAAKSEVNVTVIDNASGMDVVGVTDPMGVYNVYVKPSANCTLRVDQRIAEVVDQGMRYYRYTANQSFAVGNPISVLVSVSLERELYNVTLSGRLVGSTGFGSQSIQMLPVGSSGLPAEFDAGDAGQFSHAVMPGSYILYALDDQERKAALLPVEVPLAGLGDLEVQMGNAMKLSGNVFYAGSVPAETTINVSLPGPAKLQVGSPGGYYEVWLPPGTYNVSAMRSATESGTAVSYERNSTVELLGNTRLNIELDRANVYGVQIEWDSIQNIVRQPGSNFTYFFSVKNVGNLEDSYDLAAIGDNGWKFKLDRTKVSLMPSESEVVSLWAHVADDAKVQHVPITVTAVSTNESATAAVSKDMDANVTQSFKMALAPSAVAPIQTTDRISFAVTLTNQGNGNDLFSLRLANVGEIERSGWRVAWNTTKSGGEVNGTTLTKVAVNALSPAEVSFDVVRISLSAAHMNDVQIVASSEGDPNAFDVLSVRLEPAVLEMSGEPAADGAPVVSVDPAATALTNLLGAAAFVTAVLVTYYIARRRRWL
jgi:asparagine N-glycosylation enzyme membrane subunit Stt3